MLVSDTNTESDDKAEAPRLCFNSAEDALNFARHSAEDSVRWLTANRIDLYELYKNSHLELVIRFVSMRDADQYHLVFRAIPPRWPRCLLRGSGVGVGAAHAGDHGCDFEDSFVFGGVSQLVHGPKEMVPSFVWLKRDHQIKDFFRDVSGAPLWGSCVFQSGSGVGEGEMSVLPFVARGACDGVPGLIERGSQMVDGLEGKPGDFPWHGFSEDDLVDIFGSVNVVFDQLAVWVRPSKRIKLGLQFLGASLGKLDAIP